MSSMSVNSLIENEDNNNDNNLNIDPESSNRLPLSKGDKDFNSKKRPSTETTTNLKPPFQEQQQQSKQQASIPSLSKLNELISQSQSQSQSNVSTSTYPSPIQTRKPNYENQNQGLLDLLGSNVSSFPYSEQTYYEALKLRSEQEKTKQEYYKAESANRNLLILQTALKAQIPTNLIPLIYIGQGQNNENYEEQLRMIQQSISTKPMTSATSQFAYPPPQPQVSQVPPSQNNVSQDFQGQGNVFQQSNSNPNQIFQHKKSSSISGSGRTEMLQHDSLNASNVPPLGFKFGSGSGSTNQRPLSPAKIGAQAVANLTTPTTPYRGYPRRNPPRSNQHQRHYSMPNESSMNLNLNTKSNSVNSIRSNNRQNSQSNIDYDEKMLQSPLGLQSTLQVKPIPAQPLHKQNKSQHLPSQESMTSFQHVIQFHHWKPVLGQHGPITPASQNDPSRGRRSHKRHKSMNEQQQSTITQPPIQQQSQGNKNDEILEQEFDEEEVNLSMDATFEEDANPPLGHSRQKLNVGRYPHNIMSSNK